MGGGKGWVIPCSSLRCEGAVWLHWYGEMDLDGGRRELLRSTPILSCALFICTLAWPLPVITDRNTESSDALHYEFVCVL